MKWGIHCHKARLLRTASPPRQEGGRCACRGFGCCRRYITVGGTRQRSRGGLDPRESSTGRQVSGGAINRGIEVRRSVTPRGPVRLRNTVAAEQAEAVLGNSSSGPLLMSRRQPPRRGPKPAYVVKDIIIHMTKIVRTIRTLTTWQVFHASAPSERLRSIVIIGRSRHPPPARLPARCPTRRQIRLSWTLAVP
jgi:hypothetical protein